MVQYNYVNFQCLDMEENIMKNKKATKNQHPLDTPVSEPKVKFERLYKWVFRIMEENNLDTLYLSDTANRRIFVRPLQVYSKFSFEEETMRLLVDMLNSSKMYSATFTEAGYVECSYVKIEKAATN